jgi:acyl dehydratase
LLLDGARSPRYRLPATVRIAVADKGSEGAQMPGIWFDELHLGQVFDHPIRRTVTETDNVLFTAMTHNPALLHLDEEYMKGTEFGARIVNSVFTLGLMVGISVGDTTLGTAVANLGWDEVRFPKPLFHGDTVNVRTEVIELRESKSRPDAGIVTFLHQAFNQHGDLIASCKRSGLQRKKPVA